MKAYDVNQRNFNILRSGTLAPNHLEEGAPDQGGCDDVPIRGRISSVYARYPREKG
jgi:hypothetical protein